MEIQSTKPAQLPVLVLQQSRCTLIPTLMSRCVCMSVRSASTLRQLPPELVCQPAHHHSSTKSPTNVSLPVQPVSSQRLQVANVWVHVLEDCSPQVLWFNAHQVTPNVILDCPIGSFADSTTYRCVTQCPPSYFADSTAADYVCRLVCSNTSEYGHPLTRTCVAVAGCATPYIYADDTSRQCVTKCPLTASTYGDNSTFTCISACAGTYPLKDPSTQTCVANCPVNPSLYAYALGG